MNSKTKIIATIGPATKTKEVMSELINAGMDIARLNFSWGTHEEHRELIKNIRESSSEKNKNIEIIQDLSGPRTQDENGHYFSGAEEVITEKDIEDLKFGIKENVDYIALSFVKDENDIIKLRNLIKENGGEQKIIAKIERVEAFQNLNKILKETDAVMVARGDLGNEFPLEEIPFVQHKIIGNANTMNKMVIVATQMLLSMVNSDKPTRAEVSDVAYAILDGADAVMLSEESATGKYPVLAVSFMEKIAKVAEKNKKENIIIG